MTDAPEPIQRRVRDLRSESRMLEMQGDNEGAWTCLVDAHVLSQRWATPHVLVHWSMLCLAWRSRMAGEFLGQVTRLLLAAPASLSGRYPAGNTGRADVSAFAPAPIPEHLRQLLDDAADSE